MARGLWWSFTAGWNPGDGAVPNLLIAQLDYIYFFYGLGLFLLGAVCLSMSRAGPLPTPWWLLGASALTHGVAEWLHLLALTVADSAPFQLGRTALIGASFLLLLEFARRNHRILLGRQVAPWLHLVPVTLLAGLTAMGGLSSLETSVRLVIAAPALAWTASHFLVAAARSEAMGGGPASRRARLWSGGTLLAFGVAAGLVVPRAAYLPGPWPSAEDFQQWTGVPIQLVRGLVICAMALSIWLLAVSFDSAGRVLRKRQLLFRVLVLSLTVILAGGWVFTDRLGRLHDRDVIEEAEASTAQVFDHLQNEMEGADRGARTLSRLLQRYYLEADTIEPGRLDGLVDSLALASEGWVVYIIDATGQTISTSNRGRPDSFLGQNYAQRDYFKDAVAGRPGRFFGMGRVSRIPGYFASEAVYGADGRLVAVGVVKRNLEAEQLGPTVSDETYLVSAEGQVLVATRPVPAGLRLWSVPGGAAPERSPSAPGLAQAPFDHPVVGTEWVSLDQQKRVAVRRPLPGSDWSLVLLKQEKNQVVNRLLGIVITLLLCSVVLTYFVAMQYQLGDESMISGKRRDAETRARDSARQADTDPLTGVFNRAGFGGVFASELERSRRYGQPLSVVMIDLDHFKRVNDVHGHKAGDQVLVGVSRIIEVNVRDSDSVGRWGGEEFVVLAASTPAGGAVRLAEKLRGLMASTSLGPAGPVTGSFGVAELRPGDTVESLVSRADGALYRAKAQGRNRVECHDLDAAEVLAASAPPAVAAPLLLDGAATYARTGFAPLDEEHRVLSEAVEALSEMLSTGRSEEVQVAFETIIAGIGAHFDHEERFMKAHGYPDQARHAVAHARLIEEARQLLAGLEQGGVTIPYRRWVVGYLPEWIRRHIGEHDVELGRFLQQAGAGDRDGDLPRGARLARVG
jgi:diguanylate cyclase (GGDEF)-like protein/hemerythrin-like metal-binding protein